jgi:hypothetical protein
MASSSYYLFFCQKEIKIEEIFSFNIKIHFGNYTLKTILIQNIQK